MMLELIFKLFIYLLLCAYVKPMVQLLTYMCKRFIKLISGFIDVLY